MGSTAFPNDGSFLERFKQMQGNSTAATTTTATTTATGTTTATSATTVTSATTAISAAEATSSLTMKKTTFALAKPSNGKLAFSLKPKSKLPVTALKLDDNDDDEEQLPEIPPKRLKSDKSADVSDNVSNSAPPAPPTDPDVRKVADKLASFVAKSGRQFEDITRQKNPTDPRFGFLFDVNCSEYRYYEHRRVQEELQLKQSPGSQSPLSGATPARLQPQTNHIRVTRNERSESYQTPASALYSHAEDELPQKLPQDQAAKQSTEPAADSLSMMEFYMKKAAQEDLRRPPKYSKDEMPPPTSLQVAAASAAALKKGHHMGDYIPQEELEKFMAKCTDVSAQKNVLECMEKAKIQADNVGHRLLSRMGWKEGEGLGRGGRSDPVEAGSVKMNNLGVGAEQPGEVSSEDDIYEQYKKRMMLGYRFRPNPLNNPRKAYY